MTPASLTRLEARFATMPDPSASPDRWHEIGNRLCAQRLAADLAAAERADEPRSYLFGVSTLAVMSA